MLVLSRQRDEDVIITTKSGERIIVTIVDIRGDKVRLGFTADESVAIHRREVQEAIERENARYHEFTADGRGGTRSPDSGELPSILPAEAVSDLSVSQGPQYLGSDADV